MTDDIPPSTNTTAQDRFVILVALVLGLLLVAWFLPGTRLKHFNPSNGAAQASLRTKEEVWSDPAFPDPATSRIDDLEGRLVEIETSLGNKVDELKTATATDVEALQKKIGGYVHEIEALKARLAALEQQPSPDASLRIELVKRIEFLELQLGRLRDDTAQTRLFVEDGESLGGKASDLYRRLKDLAPADVTALEAEYAKIDQEVPARPVVRVKYDLAESKVPDADLPRLRQLMAESPEGTYFLVAGYADQSGDASANRVLSSKRASNVADVLDRALKAGQSVRAIYLGQTNRFGAQEENRVVEIWAIRP